MQDKTKIDDGGPAFPEIWIDAEFSPGGETHIKSIRVTQSGMSIRDYACIHLRIPATGNLWLDKLIAEAERRDLTAIAMAHIGPHLAAAIAKDYPPPTAYDVVKLSTNIADELLAARKP